MIIYLVVNLLLVWCVMRVKVVRKTTKMLLNFSPSVTYFYVIFFSVQIVCLINLGACLLVSLLLVWCLMYAKPVRKITKNA